MDENIMMPNVQDVEEENSEVSLRPKYLKDYIGQKKVKENMKVYIEAAKKTSELRLSLFVKMDEAGCLNATKGCYTESTEDQQALMNAQMDKIYAKASLALNADNTLSDVYVDLYNVSVNEGDTEDEQ